MSIKSLLLLAPALLALTSSSGCFWLTTEGPFLGPLAIPVPVSPYFQDDKEDKFWEKERYGRAPILGPIAAGGPAIALDEPSDDEVRIPA